MKNRRIVTGIGVGAVSMLMIFVLVCLIVFAALSILSANADYSLTKRTAKSLSDYYNADISAQEKLAEIDSKLNIMMDSADSETNYLTQCQSLPTMINWIKVEKKTDLNSSVQLVLRYSVTVNDRQALSIALIPSFVNADQKKRYQIIEWQLVNTEEWLPIKEKLNVWSGK